jgi:DNA-binding winged helix-turn-helix (wHTH) protein
MRDGPVCYVQNVRGVGYRFAAPSPESLTFHNTLTAARGTDVVGRASIIDSFRDPMETSLQFGPFSWLPDRQRLLKSGKPVPMRPRVAAILAILLERPGALVLKKEIRRRAWPVSVVGDATLRGYIIAIRKLLNAGFPGVECVQSVIGHGYRLVLPTGSAAGFSGDAARTTGNLPRAFGACST